MGFSFDEILDKFKAITQGPVKPIPDEKMAEIRAQLAERCPKSRAVHARAEQCMPGGIEHMLTIRDPFAVTFKRARGTTFVDLDDNEYVDFLMGAGPIILGHNYPPLVEKLQALLPDEGNVTGWPSEFEVKAIEKIKSHFPAVDRFKFFQSGTEADMAALRLARVFTEKKKVIRVGGSYHGWSDQLMSDIHVPHSGRLEAHGIPRGCFKQMEAVAPNDVNELRTTFTRAQKRGGVAAVILEPLGGESGAIPCDPEYPRAARELCDEFGALLVFDEVVTAFRLDMGGAQHYYGVTPDLTVFGKVLTHGYPSSGGLGGRADVMNCLVAGLEPGKDRAFTAGTMLGNPFSAAVCYWTLEALEETNAVEKAAKTGDLVSKRLNDLFQDHHRPYFAYNFNSIMHFETYAPVMMDIRDPANIQKALQRKAYVDRIALALLGEGLITKYGNRGFACMAHAPKDVDRLVAGFEKVLGWIPEY